MYWFAHKTATLTSIQHTVPRPPNPTGYGLQLKQVQSVLPLGLSRKLREIEIFLRYSTQPAQNKDKVLFVWLFLLRLG